MAKHKHYDIIKEWIKDTSKKVEYQNTGSEDWHSTEKPVWTEGYKYRFADEFRELKEAHQNGAKIQCLNERTSPGKWMDVRNPQWTSGKQYRIKPECIPIDDFIEKIRGRWVKNCRTKNESLITGISISKKLINLGIGVKISFYDLADSYKFLDGSSIPKCEGYD